jgi:pimeloyl-ACP methyl ester carboxylesterase
LPADPILLLHGQPGSARDWDGVIAALGEGAKAIAIDRPGWDGRSDARGFDGNADAALSALDAAGVDTAAVAGHSFGAAVAAWLAARAPERVSRLFLVGPAVNVASLYPIDRWLAAPVFGEAAGAAALSGLGATLSAGPLRRRIAGGLGLDERYLRGAGKRLLDPRRWRAFADEQRTLVRELAALEQRLHAIAAPTTIIAGTADRVIPRRSVKQLAVQVPGAELRWVEGAGHLLPLRHPAEVASVLLEASAPSGASAAASGPRPGDGRRGTGR